MVVLDLESRHELAGRDAVAQDEHAVEAVRVLRCDDLTQAVFLPDLEGLFADHADALREGLDFLIHGKIVHAGGDLAEEGGLVLLLGAVADDGDGLAAVERGVARGAVAHAAAEEGLLAGQKLAGDHAGGENERARLVDRLRALQAVVIAEVVGGGDLVLRHRDADRIEARLKRGAEVGARDVRQAEIVLDGMRLRDLGAQILTPDEQHGLVADLRRDRGGKPGRPGADDGNVITHLEYSFLWERWFFS